MQPLIPASVRIVCHGRPRKLKEPAGRTRGGVWTLLIQRQRRLLVALAAA